ncbi:MAG: hypothetical protein AB8I08_34975 [Sandaracinaceae bacterium]
MFDTAPLLETDTICIRFLEQEIVIFERTEVALPASEDELRAVYQRMVEAMPAQRAQLDLVVDSRRAQGRNDEAFERIQGEFRDPLFGGFRRLAVLVNSPTGRLQVSRYKNERPEPITVFNEMDDALEMLRAVRSLWPTAYASIPPR